MDTIKEPTSRDLALQVCKRILRAIQPGGYVMDTETMARKALRLEAARVAEQERITNKRRREEARYQRYEREREAEKLTERKARGRKLALRNRIAKFLEARKVRIGSYRGDSFYISLWGDLDVSVARRINDSDRKPTRRVKNREFTKDLATLRLVKKEFGGRIKFESMKEKNWAGNTLITSATLTIRKGV